MNKEKTIKTVSLIFIDIFFMAITYIIADLIFNKANLTIDPNFPKFIPLLILIKIGIYFIAGLYKEETRGIIFEISCVALANILVFILVRFILKVGVSTYLQLIALTVDIIVETISRSLILSVSEEELEQDNDIQVFDDPMDYSEELRLNKMKKELMEIKNQEQQQKEQTKQALEELKEKENQLKQKEEQLKTFEHTLSLKELNIQKELEKLEKEKEEKIKLENEIKKQEQLRKQRLKQQEILDGVLDNIKTIHTSLNERSKVVDMQEHNLMLKMYDITKKEIDQKTSQDPPKKRKHLSDKELLEETYKKIGQKKKRVNSSYTKNKTTKADNKKENIKNKSLSEALKESSLINTSKEEKENDEFMKFLFNDKNIDNYKIINDSKPKEKKVNKSVKTNINKNEETLKKSNDNIILNKKLTKQTQIDDNKKINERKLQNNKNDLKDKKEITKKDQIDLMFSEDDFDKIADLIDKM